MKRHLTLLLLLAALSSVLAPARADDDDDNRDRKRLDAAVERGEVLPLSQILARVKPGIEGRIVEIEFEYSHGAPIYEIYVLSRDGRRLEYEIDARTATILNFEDDN
ncbi:PepSY domain-containing protein [Hoeflea sp.]|uniref:PepSY domain-containing protein n=1 Tax=Hoeflea sp. TaxID=1940281 RepID=UPI0019BE7196|nr:PepSY domain-containing protein [Hoeflea sp.]MBC7280699.1 PepSY domain-containing protein [Hoeflea sp.]